MIAKFRFELRPTVSTDITGLMGIDHSCDSEYVWQLDLQKSSGQIAAVLREVRLPRAIHVKYPREVFSLADEWNHNTRMLTALGSNRHPVGYIRYFENVTAGSVWISDLAVSLDLAVEASELRWRYRYRTGLLNKAFVKSFLRCRPRIIPRYVWPINWASNSPGIMIIIMQRRM